MGFDLLTLLRRDRDGVQCERTFRAVYLLLSAWCRFKDPQRPTEGRGKLQAIPFDKLIMAFARFWNETFRRTGEKLKKKEPQTITDQEHQYAVTFPVPFPELPGKHGAGLAVRHDDDSPPEFMVKVLYRLRQDDILPYFDIVPPVDAPQEPNDYRTTIEPALSAAADDGLLEDFTQKEREVIRDLQNAFKRLTAEELRALGTHENFEKTAADIEREFRWMQNAVSEMHRCIRAGMPFHQAAQEVLEFADEACRKSERNRENYVNARNRVLAELNHADTKQAFEDCQASHVDIWDRNEMKQLAKRARCGYARARYLERIAHWASPAKQRSLSRNAEAALAEAIAELTSAGIRGLPESLDHVFVGSSTVLQEAAKEKLLEVVAALKIP